MRGAARACRRGFTLIELMVVIAVVAIVMVLAAPSFKDMIEMQRLRGVTNQLVTDLQFARSEAVARQEVTGVSFNLATTQGAMSCYVVHTCGTAGTYCTCDCTAAPGNRCAVGQREIRTVQITADSGLRLVPIPAFPGDHPVNLQFDPATGAMAAFYIAGISTTPLPSGREFLIATSLTSPGATRRINVDVGLTGRPRPCVPAGSVVSGGSPC